MKANWKPVKYKEGSRAYERAANELAREHTPIMPCVQCGRPRLYAYCCFTCKCGCPYAYVCDCKERRSK
jgi:hypothetical protein